MEKKNPLFSVQNFAMKVIDYSKNDDGTWKLSFLKFCFQEFDHLGENNIVPFINTLVNYLDSNPSSLSKFKISQFLSMLQFQEIPCLDQAYVLLGPKITEIAEKLGNDLLSLATQKLLKSLIYSPQTKAKSIRYLVN